MNIRVIFRLDGSGLCMDPAEPIHLDALIAWSLAPHQGIRHLQRDDAAPTRVALPLMAGRIGGHEVWRASALLPVGPHGEAIWHWRKRLRQSRIDLTTGSPNLTNGTYRDWQMPMQLMLCRELHAYAVGSRREVRKALRDVRYLGRKRAHGLGRVSEIVVEEAEADLSWVRDGRAARWLPDPSGVRLVRPAPPYWHSAGRVPHCEVGAAMAPGMTTLSSLAPPTPPTPASCG